MTASRWDVEKESETFKAVILVMFWAISFQNILSLRNPAFVQKKKKERKKEEKTTSTTLLAIHDHLLLHCHFESDFKRSTAEIASRWKSIKQ